METTTDPLIEPTSEWSDEDCIDDMHSHSSEDDEEEEPQADLNLKAANEKSHTEMRASILSIQKNDELDSGEKAKRIQQLMTKNWSDKQPKNYGLWNKLDDKNEEYGQVTTQDRIVTFHSKEDNVMGCKHYQRCCKLQAHCCGKWYLIDDLFIRFTCRFCHDEVSDHSIVRNLTTNMMCMFCSTVQPAAQKCINCDKLVSKYYCQDCKLWDDDPKKNIYHCHDCGICRIGKGLGIDYFHCQTCNICMAISLKGKHKCIERNLESDCPICGEYMFTSTTTVIFMPCGHCIHYKCHQEYTQTNYQCPTCFKSLANMSEYFSRIDAMLEQHEMPPEYTNTRSYVYCNDCEKKGWSKHHFLYHKCFYCKGYNTKLLSTAEVGDTDPLVEQNQQTEQQNPPE